MYRVYFVQYTLWDGGFVRVCLKRTNAYGKANVVDLYDTSSLENRPIIKSAKINAIIGERQNGDGVHFYSIIYGIHA